MQHATRHPNSSPAHLALSTPAPARCGLLSRRAALGLLLAVGLFAGGGWWLQRAGVLESLRTETMTDAERVAAIVELMNRISPEEATLELAQPPAEKLVLRGRIRTADGGPLPERVQAYIHTQVRTNSSVGSSAVVDLREENDFEIELRRGVSWVNFHVKEFLPVLLGPFGAGDGQATEGLEVVLARGAPVQIRVVDSAGRPAADAKVSVAAIFAETSGGVYQEWKTDADGNVVIESVSPEIDYQILVDAAGHPRLDRGRTKLPLDEMLTLHLPDARPIRGVVRNAAGAPLPHATISLYLEIEPGTHSERSYGYPGKEMATANEIGEYEIIELTEEKHFTLVALAEGYAPSAVSSVQLGTSAVDFVLTPELTVSGVIRGTPEQLEELQRERGLSKTITVAGHWQEIRVPFDVVDGEGRFEIKGLPTGKFRLTVDGEVFERDLTESIADWEVDLQAIKAKTEGSMRRIVRLRFERDGVQVFPRGSVRLSAEAPNGRNLFSYDERFVNDAGVVEVEMETPSRLRVREDQLVGFLIPDRNFSADAIDVPEGMLPLEIPVRVAPAGAVSGRVLRPDGSPANHARVWASFQWVDPLTGNSIGSSSQAQANKSGEYVLSRVPFDSEYHVGAGIDEYAVVSSEFTLRPHDPLPTVDLTFGPSASATVRIVDGDGQPLPGMQVRLISKHPDLSHTWVYHATDAKGEYRFPAISRDYAGHYHVEVAAGLGYQQNNAAIQLDTVNEIVLSPGLVIRGVLLDKDGRPLSGAEVHANMLNATGPWPGLRQADALTNHAGEFQFSNLSPGNYKVFTLDMDQSKAPDVQPGPAAEAQPVTVRKNQ